MAHNSASQALFAGFEATTKAPFQVLRIFLNLVGLLECCVCRTGVLRHYFPLRSLGLLLG